MPIQTLKMYFATCLLERLPPSPSFWGIGCTSFFIRFRFHYFSLHPPSLQIASHWGLIVECTHGPSIWKCAFVILRPDLYVLWLYAFIANELKRDMPVFIFFEEKDVLKLYSDMISKLSEGLTRQGFLELFPEMILHLISRGQHCLSQLDATYTCSNFEYCSVIDILRGTFLEIVEKVSCIWCSFASWQRRHCQGYLPW